MCQMLRVMCHVSGVRCHMPGVRCHFSKHWPMICPYVCVFVCVFTFEVLLKRLFAPTSQGPMSKNLEIRNPWGKVMEISGLTIENFY